MYSLRAVLIGLLSINSELLIWRYFHRNSHNFSNRNISRKCYLYHPIADHWKFRCPLQGFAKAVDKTASNYNHKPCRYDEFLYFCYFLVLWSLLLIKAWASLYSYTWSCITSHQHVMFLPISVSYFFLRIPWIIISALFPQHRYIKLLSCIFFSLYINDFLSFFSTSAFFSPWKASSYIAHITLENGRIKDVEK